jgi:hypothetical protein
VGVIYNDGTGTVAGEVKIFRIPPRFGVLGSNSVRTLDGEAAGDRSGWSVDSSSSDGSRVAMWGPTTTTVVVQTRAM